MNKQTALITLLATVVGCGASNPVGNVRFVNAPVVWKVNDRIHLDKQPEETKFLRQLFHFDGYYLQYKRRAGIERDVRSQGVNAFDEVPDSTWFTNRIGTGNLSPDEVRRGAGSGESPDKAFPWTIVKSKDGGKEPGFLVQDARKRKFLLKFDPVHVPEVQTGADAVASRLFWAAGYNTAEDHVVYFREQDVRIAPDATVLVLGHKKKLEWSHLREALKVSGSASDGSYRGLASMFIEGKPLGGASSLGTREDDPNDRIPHQLRRDQRGMYAFLSWIAHNDIKEDNTLDAYQKDPRSPSIQYVVHYLVDFGGALGAQASAALRPEFDFQFLFDPKEAAKSFVTLGVHKQPWEGRVDPRVPGIGVYSADDFVPEKWKPASPGQYPVMTADRIDNFWGAKIAMRFTRKHLEAAVDAGRYSDPTSAKYLVDTLVARQRKLAKHWFARTNPIDEVKVNGNRMCFTDLALKYGLETEPTAFTLRAFDEHGTDTGFKQTISADAHGRTCVQDLKMIKSGSRYTIYRVESSRGMPGTLIHLAADPTTQQPRVIGIYRL